MPYSDTIDAKRKPSSAALADAKARSGRWQVRWIKRWDLKCPLSDTEVLAIKEALASGHPVACGLRWPKVFRGHELTAGRHRLRVTAVGKNAMSSNYFIGLDAIDLIATETLR